MRTLLLLPFLLLFGSSGAGIYGTDEDSSVVVLGSKWFKSRQAVEKPEDPGASAPAAPARALTAADKNFERNRRVNDPVARDPNADTIDARSAALEKSVQDARAPKSKVLDGFSYRAKIRNTGQKVIEIVFWEYQFTDASDPSAVVRRQFLCGVNIKPDKEKELQAFSLSGPSHVVSVESLSNKGQSPFHEKVVINRVEYADGTIWQRKDWNFGEVRLSYRRAVGTPWGAEMCRGL